jgi:hypothetical protein
MLPALLALPICAACADGAVIASWVVHSSFHIGVQVFSLLVFQIVWISEEKYFMSCLEEFLNTWGKNPLTSLHSLALRLHQTINKIILLLLYLYARAHDKMPNAKKPSQHLQTQSSDISAERR